MSDKRKWHGIHTVKLEMGLAHINCKLLENSYVLLESRAHTGNIAQMMFLFNDIAATPAAKKAS